MFLDLFKHRTIQNRLTNDCKKGKSNSIKYLHLFLCMFFSQPELHQTPPVKEDSPLPPNRNLTVSFN